MDILIVDDQTENLKSGMQAAMEALGMQKKPREARGKYNAFGDDHVISGATNTKDATTMMDEDLNDVLICDVQMPCVRDRDKEPMTSAETPGGVSVALEALSKGIPVVFCSDAYHHGDALEWLYRSYRYLEEMAGVPVKLVTETNEEGEKRWGEAVEVAMDIVEE